MVVNLQIYSHLLKFLEHNQTTIIQIPSFFLSFFFSLSLSVCLIQLLSYSLIYISIFLSFIYFFWIIVSFF